MAETKRQLMNETEAWQAMVSEVFSGFSEWRQASDVIEKQLPALRDVTIETAVNTAEMQQTIERAKAAAAAIVEQIERQERINATQEELAIQQGIILSELWAIRETPARVINFLGNVTTVLANFDWWLASSVPFAVRWLKIIHPSTWAEAVQQLPLNLLLDMREALDRAIQIVSARIIDPPKATNEDPTNRG